MYQSVMGAELQAVDSMHKFVWSKLVGDMFEKMENAFMFGDLVSCFGVELERKLREYGKQWSVFLSSLNVY